MKITDISHINCTIHVITLLLVKVKFKEKKWFKLKINYAG